MPCFDECCVLIPAATLEDFPSELSDADARSLLAAWTVLWHPQLLADADQLPAWYRADAPPDPIGDRLVVAPTPSLTQLPDGYEARARQGESGRWITGATREELLGKLGLDAKKAVANAERSVTVEDFFAAGFAALQVQVMTRRLRYTSNLDEIHLQNRVLSAAKSFLDADASEAIDALHDVFDCLAEERDHYFASDPYLIDLTLTSPSTLPSLLEELARGDLTTDCYQQNDQDDAVLGASSNILVDSEVAQCLARLDDDPRVGELRELLSSGQVGWAGGGPGADVCLDAMTFSQAESAFCDAFRQTREAIGSAPMVYGRFSGSTPSDLTGTLVRLGYCGMIPLDFAGGRGFGDEAKVIREAAGAKLDALTAKPIDAASDASFLSLGARLGEAIDSGEIATALLAHWPAQVCDAFRDLRRVATWSLALGRFWKLEEYFRQGERPYHHGTGQAASPDASQLLGSLAHQESADPLSAFAGAFRQMVIDEQQAILAGMADLVTGEPVSKQDAAVRFAEAVTGSGEDCGDAMLLVNPHAIGCRDSVTMPAAAPLTGGHVYATSTEGGQMTTTVDIPACGFAVIRSCDPANSKPRSIGKVIREKLFGAKQPIAENLRLQNEFMEVAISDESGGISGVYSGTGRGNRFSLRLIHNAGRPSGGDRETQMRCTDLRVVTSTAAVGSIESKGEIVDGDSPAALATFALRFTLLRGSRTLRVEGEISANNDVGDVSWDHYYAARVAVESESAIYRSLLRDKVHRARSRRLVAPLGVVIDEAERQTLVAAGGLAFHRRVGQRFLDTLLPAAGGATTKFTLDFGFDVRYPVAVARSLIAAPIQVPVQASGSLADLGWILHCSAKEILISQLRVDRRRDGRLAAIMRVIQTRSQSCKGSIRFMRDVDYATELRRPDDDWLNSPQGDAEVAPSDSGDDASATPAQGPPSAADRAALRCQGDCLWITVPSHGVIDLLVVFADDSGTA